MLEMNKQPESMELNISNHEGSGFDDDDASLVLSFELELLESEERRSSPATDAGDDDLSLTTFDSTQYHRSHNHSSSMWSSNSFFGGGGGGGSSSSLHSPKTGEGTTTIRNAAEGTKNSGRNKNCELEDKVPTSKELIAKDELDPSSALSRVSVSDVTIETTEHSFAGDEEDQDVEPTKEQPNRSPQPQQQQPEISAESLQERK